MSDEFLTKLPTREFIQGDTFTIAFQFTDMDNGVIIPNASQITWNLCTYDYYETVVLSLNGTNNSSQITIDSKTGIVYITLRSSDTINLRDGKYIQQPILTHEGNTYIRAWGEVIFRRKVGGM
mgnify:FL=1